MKQKRYFTESELIGFVNHMNNEGSLTAYAKEINASNVTLSCMIDRALEKKVLYKYGRNYALKPNPDIKEDKSDNDSEDELGFGQTGQRVRMFSPNLKTACLIDTDSPDKGTRFLKNDDTLQRIDGIMSFMKDNDSHAVKELFKQLVVEMFKSDLK